MNIFNRTGGTPAIFNQAKEALQERTRLLTLIAKAEADETRAIAAVAGAESRLANEEAELAISGASGPSSARQTLREARFDIEAASARIHGLRKKLAEVEATLEQQHEALHAARAEWNRQQVEAFAPEYLKAVAAFSAINRKMRALGEALGEQTVISAAQDAAAFSPETGEFILEDAVAGGHPLGWAYLQWDPDWKNDAKAKAIFDANTWPAAIAQQLASVIGVIRTETMERNRQAQTAAHAANIEKAKERAASGAILVSTYDADGEPTFKHVMPGKATNAA